MIRNEIRLRKKDEIITITKKPHIKILNEDLIEIIKYDEDETIIKFKKDTYILGRPSKERKFYSVSYLLENIKGRKHSRTVTPWTELSEILKTKGVEPIKVYGRGVEPLHYNDELCIPENTEERNGLFYIIKNEDLHIYINKILTPEEKKIERNKYYKKEKDNEILKFHEVIGRYIENEITINENIDLLEVFFINSNKEIKKIHFNIKNKIVDVYRFLLIFDGDEYEDIISKKIINESQKIKIETKYKNKKIQSIFIKIDKKLNFLKNEVINH